MANYFSVGIVLACAFFVPVQNVCNFQNCAKSKPGMLNVHIFSHSHDDIGWLKTIDEYYYGDKSYIQRAGVQYILDSVIAELMRNKDRRFIYVEIGFFWRWWQEQDAETKKVVKSLVASGRLEFISGGWCMNDEAGTHYSTIIDQMTFGFKFIKDEFGSCARPRAAWQIDPFGHSREQASLFAQMGMDGMFLGRIDWQDKNYRIKTKTLETVWQASSSLGKNADLFTNIMPNTYSPPPGFCFDLLCGDEPIKDNPNLEGYNVDKKVNAFLKYTSRIAEWYDTNNVIVTMGNDFNYQQAGSWFKNLDKLIKHVNARQYNGSKVNLFYSTPSCYLKAVHDSGVRFTTKTDDFFPYASDPHAFWTGYFTSRPTLKYLDRFSNNILQAVKQVSVLGDMRSLDGYVDVLRRAMGNMQHHDAVTGTSKQPVADDYAKLVYEGLMKTTTIFSQAMTSLTGGVVETHTCLLLNISSCEPIENSQQFTVFLYNPYGHRVTYNARIPIYIDKSSAFKITSIDGEVDLYQVNALPSSVLTVPGRSSQATHELVFTSFLPALGVKSFTVKRLKNSRLSMSMPIHNPSLFKDKITLGFDTKIKLNMKTGLIESVSRDKIEVALTQYFAWYFGMKGDNMEFSRRASGAYIFRPNGIEPVSLKKATIERIIEGEVVMEVHQKFNDWVSQVVRIYKSKPYVEFNWIVGPIPIGDSEGKEVIFRVSSELESAETFYTDSNGREVLQRKRDVCPAPGCLKTEPVSSNYYPVNAKIFIKDQKKKLALTVLTDRSQGGTSLESGQIDLMVHRRLLNDDAFGVDEPLNETAFGEGLVTRGTHQLLISPFSTHNQEHRVLATQNYLAPVVLVSNGAVRKHLQFEGIDIKSLPQSINILTLEFYGEHVLLRLEHFFEMKDDPVWSRPAKVDLKLLFEGFTIFDVDETILGGNDIRDNVHRLIWNYEQKHDEATNQHSRKEFVYTINPMEIKTFILKTSLK